VVRAVARARAAQRAAGAHPRARPDDLSPVEAQRAPPEIEPLVTSFNDLLARLEQNMALQKRFIADAAHQMKTPLAGLRTQAELALRHPVPPDVQRSLEQIATSSEQAARLVTQLLALARAENRASGLTLEPVEIAELRAARCATGCRPRSRRWTSATKARTTTRRSTSTATPMLREMLGNLVDNAIRYTPDGGRITVRVRAERDAQRVHPSGGHRPGIPAAERGVVERFYRSSAAKTAAAWGCRSCARSPSTRRHADDRRSRVPADAAPRGHAGAHQPAALSGSAAD
jgi:two-component system sensor histidine kinase TctE